MSGYVVCYVFVVISDVFADQFTSIKMTEKSNLEKSWDTSNTNRFENILL